MAKVGVIGGSGLDNPEILSNPRDEKISTPYGEPSSALKLGTIGGGSPCPARKGTYHPAVTWEAVLKVFSENAAKVTRLLTEVIPRIG